MAEVLRFVVMRFYFSTLMFVLLGIAMQAAPAQTGSVNLSDPALKANAALLRNNPRGARLSDSLGLAQANATAKGITSSGVDTTVIDEPEVSPSGISFPKLLQARACLADVIVSGNPISWVHHLSASATAIYADYDFAIDSIIKNNVTVPLSSGIHIVVTRPSGSLNLGTGSLKTINFENEEFPHLQSTVKYLMFFRYIPSTHSYEAMDRYSTFSLNALQWTMTRKAYAGMSFPSLSTDITSWLTACPK